MAAFSSSSSSSPAYFPSFFVISLLFHVSLSTSEFMLFPLTSSLRTNQYNSTHHLLKSTAVRSAARFKLHSHRQREQKRQNNKQVSLPLAPGSDYTISFSLGSHTAQTISLYMDTGSDLVWLPCHPFECILCEGKYNPDSISNAAPLNLSSASPVPCKSTACSAAHSSRSSSSDLCAMAKCPLEMIETSDCDLFSCPQFYYAYADGSLIARLYTDVLSIPMSSPSLVLRNFTFGCAHEALAEPIGVAGFGRGVLSLPAQLAGFSPQLGEQFSYCLVSHSFDGEQVRRRPSPLILGHHKRRTSVRSNGDEFVYTPMLDNPKYGYFYSVGLEAISVGRRRIEAPANLKTVDEQGNGGMVVDSGTTFTILPSNLYNSVAVEFTQAVGRVHKRASQIEDRTGLSPCYYFDDSAAVQIPVLTLHFLETKSGVVLPRRNYFYEFLDGGDDGKRKRKVGCLMLMNGGDGDDEEDEGGPVGTLGNYQQQEFEVVYDLKNRRVGFARRECASLWDTLNQN